MQKRREFTRRQLLTMVMGGVGVGFFNSVLASSGMEKMISRTIPSSGDEIPVIGMGTWQTFDIGSSEKDRAPLKDVLKIFRSKGARLIDSSPMYGSSEKVVGDLAKELGMSKELFLATKVWTSGEAEGIRQMDESMDLLKANPIDLIQVHNLVDYSVHYKTLRRMKEQGKVRYIGITHYTVGSYPQLEAILKKDPIDFVQFNFSIATREAENKLLPLAADKKVATLINRPFESGSMFQSVRGKALPEWCRDFDCNSWAQFFLKYIVSHPAVTCVIPATANPKHMEDNLGAGFGKLPDEKLRKKMVDHFLSL